MSLELLARSRAALLVGALCLGSGAPLMAGETVEEIASRYGIRESVLDISLSPSGNKIAYIGAGPRSSETLHVIDLAGDKKPKAVLTNNDANADLSNCQFATEDRLVCEAYFILTDGDVLLGFTRLLSVGADGSPAMVLTPRTTSSQVGIRQDGGDVVALDDPSGENRILMTKRHLRDESISKLANSEAEGLGVEWVDVATGKRGRVEGPDRDAQRYMADESGAVRLKMRMPTSDTGVLDDRFLYYYRAPDSKEWLPLSQVRGDGSGGYSGFQPVAVSARENVAYGFDSVSGFDAIVRMPLAAGAQPETIVSRSDVDVDSLIRIGRQRRVVGASFATEKREIEYFDADLKKLASSLRNALPGKPLVNIVDASADETKLLIVASSDTDPGMVYLYDKTTRKLGPLMPVREHLVGQAMGAMKSVTFPAADGTQIPGYLTLPAGSDGKSLPAIVMPHGGPSARDEWGFDWLVQFFVARGYAVLQPNYRGSSGYGDAWYGKNGFQSWKTAIGDVNDAGRWLVSQGIAAPDKLSIVGWSYGGYAALQSQVLDPSLYKAVVAIAPVTDLDRLREDARHYTNARRVEQFIGSGPHVAEGSPARFADRFAAPVLLFHGTLDQNVNVGHSRLMSDKLKAAGKRVEYVEHKDLAHGLSDSTVRAQMLVKIDQFLAGTR